jgi:putative hemolysin
MSLDFFLDTPFLALFTLVGTMSMTALGAALLRLGRFKSKEILRHALFFFPSLMRRFFPRQDWDALHIAIGLSKHIYQLLYALSGLFFLETSISYFQELLYAAPSRHDLPPLILAAVFLLLVSLLSDFLARLGGTLWPRAVLRGSACLGSCYLLVLLPVIGLLLFLTRGIVRKVHSEMEATESLPSRAQIKELIRESELQQHLDSFGQRLVSSFINFKDRVAKEIMVPRVNLFSLPAETSIREAARLFAREGYSRIPVYRDSLDQIIGVVLYKDLLKFYADPPAGETTLDSTLEMIAKPVLYAPENKKISQLLQEFRMKQIHMAIIVDEYGGTEGIVTIEDILEELVGEIEDEYDIDRDQLYWALPSGGWVVDAKMSILDIEGQLGIRIPPGPEYETIGGYVFHCAGMIPPKDWRLMHDEFDLEVLSSTERSLKKIKLVPHSSQQNAES